MDRHERAGMNSQPEDNPVQISAPLPVLTAEHGLVGAISSTDATSLSDCSAGFLVSAVPVEFHCHGMGDQDFSRFDEIDLCRLEASAAAEGVLCLPTLYLPYSRLPLFVAWMRDYGERRHEFPHIVGIALEGPLLASFGGTPEQGVWSPTRTEWESLASCGAHGLRYVVLSPDAMMPGSCLLSQQTRSHPDISWIISTLIGGGVKPALGHFHKLDAIASAEAIDVVVDTAQALGAKPFSDSVLTDHLFNDMPVRIRYAWRDRASWATRRQEIDTLAPPSWTMDALGEVLGPVPARLITHASSGAITVAINFDGEHVDHEIAKRAAELAGTRSVIAMTDRSDVPFLGGQHLTKRSFSTLWYQAGGIVAAGSQPIDLAVAHLRELGFDEPEIWSMVAFVPCRVLGITPGSYASHIDQHGRRRAVASSTLSGRQ